jgi:LuxR family maltose regulon positive regulatory protein
VLVIDDVHLVEADGEVTGSLGLFLQNLPTWLRVVLTARRDPHLPIDRLRARGGFGEVRFAELRFSAAEAAEMLTRLSPALSVRETAELAAAPMAAARGIPLVTVAISGVLPERACSGVIAELQPLWHAEGLDDPTWADVYGQL